MIPIDPVVLALAASGLPTANPLPRRGWSGHLDEIIAHGLAGFLARVEAAGRVELDEGETHQLRLRLEAEAIRAVQLEGELMRLHQALETLPAVVLKGAILAHTVYPEPMLRPFTDLDILVAGRNHARAIQALEARGYVRSRPEPTPGYDARVGKALTLTHPGGVVVDLHRTLVAGVLGDWIDVNELLEDRQTIELGGVAIPGPSLEAHLIETTLHAVVGDGLTRALSIRDVAQVALHPGLDGERAVDLARRWRVTAPVAEGLRAAVEGLGVELPESLMALPEEHPADAPPAPAPVRSARSRLEELRHGDLRRRITVTRALVVPSPTFLRWAYGDQPAPQLYGRRWLSLYRRAIEARSGATVEGPALDPAPDPGDIVSTAPLVFVRPVVAQPEVVALARPPLSRDARALAPPRQVQWSRNRPRPATRTSPDANAGATEPPTTALEGGDATGGPPPPIAPPPLIPAGANGSGDTAGKAAGASPLRNDVRFFIGGLGLLVVAALVARLGWDGLGMVLVPAAAVLFAVGAAKGISRRHPSEDWVGRWLVMGVAVKLSASYLRYLTLVVGYEGGGDAAGYDLFGRKYAAFWMGNGPNPMLPDLRKTNFVKWFTGVVYYLFGSNMLLGFFVFGLLALIGSYLWYRAAVEAVPTINKRFLLALVLFAPSVAFWPSSIGKESLMQLGIGAMALGTSYLMRQRLVPALAVGIPGGWLLWVVRPHLLALVTVAAAFAYLVGRVRDRGPDVKFAAGRTLGLVIIAFLVIFTVSQGAEFLGMKDLSLTSVEQTLDEQKASTSQGGSQFDNGGDYLSPVNLPRGAATVLLRPFPWETSSPFQLLASLESALLTVLIIIRLGSLRESLVRARSSPFLLYCWVLTILYAATFSSFANFGLLVRQRSLVLPALFVLLAVSPGLGRAERRAAKRQAEVIARPKVSTLGTGD